MGQIVEEIQGLYVLYPSWLVTVCLVIVGLGLGYVAWKVVRFGLVVVVAAVLVALVAAAGWMILAP